METAPDLAAEYRQAHYGKLMVLAKCKNDVPKWDEYCRIRSVETLLPSLWITATFLDGSVQRFRPEKIRSTTFEEENSARELTDARLSDARAESTLC